VEHAERIVRHGLSSSSPAGANPAVAARITAQRVQSHPSPGMLHGIWNADLARVVGVALTGRSPR